jgi:hypothetical protein
METSAFNTSTQFSSGQPVEHFGLANPALQQATEMPAIGTSAPLLDYVDIAYSDFNFYEQSTAFSASALDECLIPEEINEPQPNEKQKLVHPSLEWRDPTHTIVDRNKRAQLYRYLKRSPWNRVITLTRSLFIGGLWTGTFANPFGISATNTRRLITSCFLTSLDLTHNTYEDMEAHPGQCLHFKRLITSRYLTNLISDYQGFRH